MAAPIILRTKAETEGTAKAFVSLAATVATSMGSISSAALMAHQSTGSSLGGIAGTALKAAASLTTMQYAAIAAFAAFAAASAAGSAELERFEAIAKRALDANVGSTFFQSFSASARAFALDVKKLEDDLGRLERSTRDTWDESRVGDVINRARDVLQERFRGTNDFGFSNAPTLYDAAQSPEQRIDAILKGLADIEASGNKLTAIFDARRLGLTSWAEEVEKGRASFQGLLEERRRLEREGVATGAIVSPELVARAEELRKNFERVSQELSQNARPILDECARLALEIGRAGVWSAERFAELVGVLGSVVKALREAAEWSWKIVVPSAPQPRGTPTAAEYEDYRSQLSDAEARLAGLPRPREGMPDALASQRQNLEAQIAQLRERVNTSTDFNRLGAVTDPYAREIAAGAPIVPVPNPDPRGEDGRRRSSQTPSARSAAAETDEWANAYEKVINNLQKTNAQLQAEFATIGKYNVERARAVELAKAEEEARRTGGTLTEEQRNRVMALAEAQAKLRDAIKDAEAAQRAFADAIQYTGDRLVDMAFNGRSLQDVLRGLAAELMRASLTGQGIFGRLLGLAPSASAPAGSVGGLLGMLTGGNSGGGGGLFNLFGGGGGGGALDFAHELSFGFAGGGFTGAGDPSEVAGKVHRGEFVFDAASTSRLGVDALEAIRQGRPTPAMPALAQANAGVQFTNHYTIDARGADQAAVERMQRGLAQRDAEFESKVVAAVRDAQDRRML